jgi:hypothetical protein
MALTKVSFSMVKGDVINVLDYGATGDGVTDDLAAIQAAINNNPGRVIYFPSGNYKVTGTIVLPFENYNATPAKANNAITLAGEPSGRQIFGTAKIFGNVVGPIIQAVGVFIGPSSTNFDATVGHGVQDLNIENTNTSISTSIGIQMAYIYCPHIVNVVVAAKAICVDLGSWTMVGNFNNVSTGSAEFGVKARACWASKWISGRAFYHKCAMYIDASDFRVTDFNAEHHNIIFDFIGSSVTVENCHIEDFDCLYTNDQNPIAQINAGYANAGSTGNGDFPALVSITGGFYLAWTTNAPYFVERPTSLAQINTLRFTNCQVDALSAPNLITVAGAFNSKTSVANGRFEFSNNYPRTSFSFLGTSAGDRQTQYISQILDQIDTNKVVNHYISKLRVGELSSNTANSFYPATRLVNAGTVATWTRTIVGARVTDYVLYQHNVDNANLFIRAFVSANDTVTITAYNPTGSSQSLGDGDESLLVLPRTAGNFSTN